MSDKCFDSALFWRGSRDILPLIIAAIPFGIVYGALGQSLGLTEWQVMGMSLFVFAGSSQFIAVTLLASAAAFPIICLTVFIVNLRHMLYAASLMHTVEKIPGILRVPMAFWLTDESYAIAANRLREKGETGMPFYAYYTGASAAMYLNWQICTWIGIIAGKQIPDMTQWGLDVAIVVAFIGMVVPSLERASHWACAFTSAVCISLTYDWPHQSGLLFSSLVAIAVGVLVMQRQKSNPEKEALE
jgi:4-azaleucine resistance transporter AzlC